MILLISEIIKMALTGFWAGFNEEQNHLSETQQRADLSQVRALENAERANQLQRETKTYATLQSIFGGQPDPTDPALGQKMDRAAQALMPFNPTLGREFLSTSQQMRKEAMAEQREVFGERLKLEDMIEKANYHKELAQRWQNQKDTADRKQTALEAYRDELTRQRDEASALKRNGKETKVGVPSKQEVLLAAQLAPEEFSNLEPASLQRLSAATVASAKQKMASGDSSGDFFQTLQESFKEVGKNFTKESSFMGFGKDVLKARRVIDSIKTESRTVNGKQTTIYRPQTEKEYNALPKGSVFIDDEGIPKVKE